MPGTRDVIDWPQPSRDGYVINNVSTIITAYAYGGMHAMKVHLLHLLTPPRCGPKRSELRFVGSCQRIGYAILRAAS
jgi:hypothetical protein